MNVYYKKIEVFAVFQHKSIVSLWKSIYNYVVHYILLVWNIIGDYFEFL